MRIAIQHLRQLPISKRIHLVEDLWDTIAEDASALNPTPEQELELDRRLDDLEAEPKAEAPCPIVRERILASL